MEKAAGGLGWHPHHVYLLNAMESGSLNVLEHSGTHLACYGTGLPFLLCSIIMWSATYIYVPMQYNYGVSTSHRYCNYLHCSNELLLSAALQRTQCSCSELFECVVWLIVIAVQLIVGGNNVVKLDTGHYKLFGCRYCSAVDGK